MALVLDYLTPLLAFPLDVRGNAQHWMIRCADAVNDRTWPNWHVRFPDQETWEVTAVERSTEKWNQYYREGAISKTGLPMRVSKRKRFLRMAASWAKASYNWDYTFREEGDAFFARLQDGTKAVEEATETYLGLLGLKLRNWLGPFSTHILLLMGNRRFWDFYDHRIELLSIHFPDPPFIPQVFKQAFNQEMMATFNRDIFLAFPHPDIEVVNLKLAVTLGSYLHQDYARWPLSFVQLERRDGTLYLHTQIMSEITAVPPQALNINVPLLQAPPFPGFVVVVPDLFAYAIPGDAPLDFGIIACDFNGTSYGSGSLWLRRSDGLSDDIQFQPPFPFLLPLPVLPDGITWQLVIRAGALATPLPSGSITGRLWFADTLGFDSNHASVLIAGKGPIAQEFRLAVPDPGPSPDPVTILANLYRYAIPGDSPLTHGTLVLDTEVFNFSAVEVWLHRTDGGGSDVRLDINQGFPHAVPPLADGQFWQLYIIIPGGLAGDLPVTFAGSHWYSDARGIESNHARWSLTISPVP